MNENGFIVFAFRYVKYEYDISLFRLHYTVYCEYNVTQEKKKNIKNESSSKKHEFFLFSFNSGV